MAFDRDFEAVKFVETHVFRADLNLIKTDLVMRAEYEQRFSTLVPLLNDIWAELPQNWLETEDGDSRFSRAAFHSVLDRVNQQGFWDIA
jgi:hypothetical protein